MPIEKNLGAELEKCAAGIVSGVRPKDLDLSQLAGVRPDSIAAYLARSVEEMTGGELTVRPAGKLLFSLHLVKNGWMDMVRCHASTPNGTVYTYEDGMMLFAIGHIGLQLNLERATPEREAADRAKLQIEEARSADWEDVKGEANAIMAIIVDRAEELNSPEASALVSSLRKPYPLPTIHEIIATCNRLGISFAEVVLDAICEPTNA